MKIKAVITVVKPRKEIQKENRLHSEGEENVFERKCNGSKMNNNIGYSLGGDDTRKKYPIENILKDALSQKTGDELIASLTRILLDVIRDRAHEYAGPYVSDLLYGDIKFSSIESLVSFLLFERAEALCKLAMNDGDMKKINRAFVDFNYAIHYSLSSEMLGLCCLYRAFFLPKEPGEDFSKNKIMQNELNIVKRKIDINSEVYKLFIGDFPITDFLPNIYYYFISDNLSDNMRYKYSFDICSLAEFKPFISKNPHLYISTIDIIHGYLPTVFSSPEYLLLSEYVIDENEFAMTMNN